MNTLKSTYGHLKKSRVRWGQKVKAGDVIGFVGNSGISTGPHLHLELSYHNRPIDPMTILANEMSGLYHNDFGAFDRWSEWWEEKVTWPVEFEVF